MGIGARKAEPAQDVSPALDEAGELLRELELRVVLDLLVAREAPRARADLLVDELHALLSQLSRVAAPGEGVLEGQLAWLQQLLRWLRARRSGLGGGAAGELSLARLRLLLAALRETPPHRRALSRLLAHAFANTDGLSLFAEAGLPADQGFLGEACDRVMGKLLPAPPDERDLSQLVARLFPCARDASWLGELGPELLAELSALLDLPQAMAPLTGTMLSALAILSARACALGLAADVRARGPQLPPAQAPFLRLPRACDALAAAVESGNPERISGAAAIVRAALASCRWVVAAVHERLEATGLSLDLVWRLERAVKTLDRIAAIVAVLAPDKAATRAAAALRLCAELVHDRVEDRSLRSLLRTSADKLARKVIERAGHSGEHYITRTRAGWHDMLSSAAGGGLLTVLTVLIKLEVLGAALPFFFEALAASLNYAGSFFVMQLFGFTLATKQPAFTAAALAAEMRPQGASAASRRIEVPALVELIARIARSQVAALLGNLGTVVPGAVAVDLASRVLRGRPLLSADTAHHLVAAMHPTRSGTVVFAALTGLLLWLASLGAGWMENWIVFRRLPEGIAGSALLRRLLGPARAARLGELVLHHAAGTGLSLTLGALLGTTPVLGRFFGLPLEVRHVTLQAGALALAFAALGPTMLVESGCPAALAGLALVGLLNFGVSFGLALAVALRGREASRTDRWSLLGALLARAARAPLSFLFAPRHQGR